MQPFSLDSFKSGTPAVTRCGLKIIDAVPDTHGKVKYTVMLSGGLQHSFLANRDGHYDLRDTPLDVFLTPGTWQ